MGRGRTEIARYLEVRVKAILTDYQAQAGGESEQVIEDDSKQITDATLSGTAVERRPRRQRLRALTTRRSA